VIELGPARECDMVLAFLEAEISSPRFSKWLLQILQTNGLTPDELIHKANLEDPQQNAIRREILQRLRGFGADSYLFSGFPSEVQWQLVEIQKSDHARLKFANEANWVRLTAGSRMVTDLAERVTRGEAPDDPAEHVRAVQKALVDGLSLPPIVLVLGDDSELILVEGHCRATAYVGLKWVAGIRALLGSSPLMRRWLFF